MPTIFGDFDIAQLTLYAFWAFFFCLVVYLQREALREGYPLENESDGKPEMTGLFGDLPAPKTWTLPHGRGTVSAPNPVKDAAEITDRKFAMKATAPWSGAPFEPTGDPMVDGIGPAAWAERADVPDLTVDGHVKIIPMRTDPEWEVTTEGRDIRGWDVIGCDGKSAGKITEIWVDRSESMIRYIEIGMDDGTVRLCPMTACIVSLRGGEVKVNSIRSDQFARIPQLKNPDQITFLEEEKICAYIAGGKMYASRDRVEPWL
jgi:photosynthetic reaction center H subunit